VNDYYCQHTVISAVITSRGINIRSVVYCLYTLNPVVLCFQVGSIVRFRVINITLH